MSDVKLEIDVIKTHRGMLRKHKLKLAREMAKIQQVCFKTKVEEIPNEVNRIVDLFSLGCIAVIKATYYHTITNEIIDIGIGIVYIDNFLDDNKSTKQYWLNELCRSVYKHPKQEISPIKYVIMQAENVVKEHYKKRKDYRIKRKLNLLVEKNPDIGNSNKLKEIYSKNYGFIDMGIRTKWSDCYYYMSKNII